MYIPQKMVENKNTKHQFLISNTIDKIRKNLDVDKYAEERKQIGKD